MNQQLRNKVAIVTGASKGIGAAIAKALAAEGAAVVVNYATSAPDAAAVVQAIEKAGGRAVAVGGNVADKATAQRLVDTAIATYGQLDIVVNNAGIYSFAPIEEITPETYRQMYDTNVLGPLLTIQAASPHLKEGASIINIGSVVSRITPPGSSLYSGTKGALDAITQVLSKEFGPRQIRVNGLNPGIIATEGTARAGILGSEFETQAVAGTPLGRVGQPTDIAQVAVFLASEAAGWVTGELLNVGGGVH